MLRGVVLVQPLGVPVELTRFNECRDDQKGETPKALACDGGLWRPFNGSLKERMTELYQNGDSCASAHGT